MPQPKIPPLGPVHTFKLESLGVKLAVTSNQQNVLLRIKNRILEVLPVKWREINAGRVKGNFHFLKDNKSVKYTLYGDEGIIISNVNCRWI